MNIQDMPVEKILAKINIQPNLIDLQSNSKEKVRSALEALAGVTLLTKRKDSLYALIGYYIMEVKTLEQIEFFFNATRSAYSPDLAYHMLKDLTHFKEASTRRIFMNAFLNYLSDIQISNSRFSIESFIQLIELSKWGEKQKQKFLDELNSNIML
jgi:hypothetical protein